MGRSFHLYIKSYKNYVQIDSNNDYSWYTKGENLLSFMTRIYPDVDRVKALRKSFSVYTKWFHYIKWYSAKKLSVI